MISDSGHGFKMTAVGKLVAGLLAGGPVADELKPFAFERFTEGRTFGARNTICPWI
jgi:glycine/D-amino acid oxidase-like deaminating enzyme